MSDTPTASGRETVATDTLGRVLKIRRMSVSERLRFMKLIPAVARDNQLWITNAMVIASVTEIDGVPCKVAKTEEDVERAGDVLGDEGISAAQDALAGLIPNASTQEALAVAGE